MSDSNPPIDSAGIEDPEQYSRHRRFKEIHDARERVVTVLAEDDALHECLDGKVPTASVNRMATLVALYVIELLPLLQQLDEGVAYGKDAFGDRMDTQSLGHFATARGLTNTQGRRPKPASVTESLQVFQVANQAYAELGMELELSAGNDDASFDYSDLLEDDQQSPPEIPQQNDD